MTRNALAIVLTAASLLAQSSTQQPERIVIQPTIEKPTSARRLPEKDFAGYLLVYFKDETHSAYFAISRDGYLFTDVNEGEPVLDGTILAEQKGIRHPHITRGPAGAFNLAMTDLHNYGKRMGLRETQWERPEEQYGWGNNRAIVLMKSWDLIHWTHSDFRADKAFPELGDIGATWAPETIYDEQAGRMMVYFTIRIGNAKTNMYYAYADEAFTKLETKPELLTDAAGIDGDITKVGDRFHLFYVFRRLGTRDYVLMYDVYGAGPNNMGFRETTDFVTFRNPGHFNEGLMKGSNFSRPKHGAVTYLTRAELNRSPAIGR